MPRPRSSTERLTAELAAVPAGQLCGWSCPHHIIDGRDGPIALVCGRATGHAGADLLIDVHVGYTAAGTLLTFDDSCCTEAGDG